MINITIKSISLQIQQSYAILKFHLCNIIHTFSISLKVNFLLHHKISKHFSNTDLIVLIIQNIDLLLWSKTFIIQNIDNGLLVKALDSLSKGTRFKTTEWLQG